MSSAAARRRSAPTGSLRPFPPPRRGLTVVLEVPADGPDGAELLGLAGALHELALDLVPGATARTEVTLTGRPPTGGAS